MHKVSSVVGPRHHRVQQYRAAGGAVVRRRAFDFGMADAVGAGHENHAGGRDLGDVAGVVAGARDDLHVGQTQGLGAGGDRRDAGRIERDRRTASPTYLYFVDMVENLRVMKPEHLTDKSVLLGSPQQIIDTVAKADDAGFSEIILYFNVGLKPHNQVLDEMQRFMEDVAPAFDGAHKRADAAAE